MVFIAYKKDWRPINLISYIASLLFLFGWALMVRGEAGAAEYMWLMVFATLFYLVYFVNDIIYNIKPDITFITFDAYILMSYTFFYIIGMWFILSGLEMTFAFKYLLAALGIFNLFYTLLIYRRANVDDELEEIILGKAVVFTVLGGYFILVDDAYINGFWVIVSILSLYSGIRLRNNLLKGTAVMTLFFAVVSMGIDWYEAYYLYAAETPFIFNGGVLAGVMTSVLIAASLFIIYYKKEDFDILYIPKESYAQTISSLLIFTSYLCGLFELIFHTRDTVGGVDFRVLVLGAYNMLYILCVRAVVNHFDVQRLRLFTGLMMGLAVVSYLIYGHFSTIALRDAFIIHDKPK